jgi:hypothetical protein
LAFFSSFLEWFAISAQVDNILSLDVLTVQMLAVIGILSLGTMIGMGIVALRLNTVLHAALEVGR